MREMFLHLNGSWLLKAHSDNVFHYSRIVNKSLLKSAHWIGNGSFILIFQIIHKDVVVLFSVRVEKSRCTKSNTNMQCCNNVISIVLDVFCVKEINHYLFAKSGTSKTYAIMQ